MGYGPYHMGHGGRHGDGASSLFQQATSGQFRVPSWCLLRLQYILCCSSWLNRFLLSSALLTCLLWFSELNTQLWGYCAYSYLLYCDQQVKTLQLIKEIRRCSTTYQIIPSAIHTISIVIPYFRIIVTTYFRIVWLIWQQPVKLIATKNFQYARNTEILKYKQYTKDIKCTHGLRGCHGMEWDVSATLTLSFRSQGWKIVLSKQNTNRLSPMAYTWKYCRTLWYSIHCPVLATFGKCTWMVFFCFVQSPQFAKELFGWVCITPTMLKVTTRNSRAFVAYAVFLLFAGIPLCSSGTRFHILFVISMHSFDILLTLELGQRQVEKRNPPAM